MLHLASRDTSRGLAAPREPRWGGPCTSRGRTAPCQNRGEVCVHVKVVLLLVSIDGGGSISRGRDISFQQRLGGPSTSRDHAGPFQQRWGGPCPSRGCAVPFQQRW